MYEEILLPTDGSEAAERAAEHAIDLADRYDARLVVCYVVDVRSTYGKAPQLTVDKLTAALEDDGAAVTDSVVDRAQEAGVDATGVVLEGVPSDAICQYADGQDVDLVVMGARGLTGIDRVRLGSVSERVVRTAPVPVLTVGSVDGE